ncbi:MAG: 3-deoxy-8-phosphooctulonate synthase [Abditibacteriota bacterium]|nr:3-deoxy-8-phosphooctulonate synthase [Abditibacteriota bacterium]
MKVVCGPYSAGDGCPLLLIAGPCVIESRDLCRQVAAETKEICSELGINYCFKASFDKANRTSVESFRGPGLEKGLEILMGIKEEYGLPIVTDIHEAWQAEPVSRVADVIQIPAFLCRQTDLIVAAAATGKCVNIKKGQFVAPWDMKNSLGKARSAGNENIMLTERGSSFGYNTLVVDMTGIPAMRALGAPVIIDATHSVQKPGGLGNASGGAREYIPTLLLAAMAAGADGIFMEIHPQPEKGLCDAACMFPLPGLKELLAKAVKVREAIR